MMLRHWLPPLLHRLRTLRHLRLRIHVLHREPLRVQTMAMAMAMAMAMTSGSYPRACRARRLPSPSRSCLRTRVNPVMNPTKSSFASAPSEEDPRPSMPAQHPPVPPAAVAVARAIQPSGVPAEQLGEHDKRESHSLRNNNERLYICGCEPWTAGKLAGWWMHDSVIAFALVLAERCVIVWLKRSCFRASA